MTERPEHGLDLPALAGASHRAWAGTVAVLGARCTPQVSVLGRWGVSPVNGDTFESIAAAAPRWAGIALPHAGPLLGVQILGAPTTEDGDVVACSVAVPADPAAAAVVYVGNPGTDESGEWEIGPDTFDLAGRILDHLRAAQQ